MRKRQNAGPTKGPAMAKSAWKSLKLPEDLHRPLKIAAVEQNVELNLLLCAIVRAYLDDYYSDSSTPTKNSRSQTPQRTR